MSVWTTVTGVSRVGIDLSRNVLAFGERIAPWPLSIIPRTMRLPLDLAAHIAALLAEDAAIEAASNAPQTAASEAAKAATSADAASSRPAGHDAATTTPRAGAAEAPGATARATAAEATRTSSRTTTEHSRRDEARARPASGATSKQAAAPPPPAARDAARTPAVRPAPAEEPRTATIAGARSDGPRDAPRFDRGFRARQAPLYVRDAGRGPAIVLLHAFPLSSRMWEPQLVSLADRFRVVAPDLAGFGLSWVPDTGFSLEDQAHAVELTLDDLKIDELVLVGMSMGGYVAFPLLERLGDRVRGLVLASTRATADDEDTVTERHRLAAEVEAEGVDVAAEELLPRLLGTSTLRDRPDLVDHVHALVLENKEPGVAAALRAMAARPDFSGLLPRIGCPVLVVSGEEDGIVTRDDARTMAARFPGARLELLRGGHLTSLEAPQEFDRVLDEFASHVHATQRRPARARGAGA